MTEHSEHVYPDVAGSLRVASAGLALFLLVWLLWRPPFPLAPVSLPTGVTATVQAGSVGAEQDESGTFWWISSLPASIGVANNSPNSTVVHVTLSATNGPCAVERSVEFEGRTTNLAPRAASLLFAGPITLDGYERRSLDLDVSGPPCPPTEVEPRTLYVALSAIDVSQVDN